MCDDPVDGEFGGAFLIAVGDSNLVALLLAEWDGDGLVCRNRLMFESEWDVRSEG